MNKLVQYRRALLFRAAEKLARGKCYAIREWLVKSF